MATSGIDRIIGRIDLHEVDAALRRDDEARVRPQAEKPPPTFGMLGHTFTVPQLLRLIGAAVLIAAALAFMLQNWETSNDISRYFQFLGFTVSLSAAGFLCGTRLADDRGARTFLALAAATVPAHFTFLGALLYSQFPGAQHIHYPGYARLTAPDLRGAVLAIVAGGALLAPIVWASMLALARPRARQLAAGYLLSNAFLLVPTRDPDLIGVLALTLVLATALFDLRSLHRTIALQTSEGTFVRVLMGVPAVVLLLRSLHLYEISELFASAVLAATAIVLFEIVPQYIGSRTAAKYAQATAVPPAILAWLLAAGPLLGPLSLSGRWTLPVVGLPIAGIFVGMSLRSIGATDVYRRLGALVATATTVATLSLHPGVAASFLCLLTAILTTAYGYSAQEKGTFAVGGAALGFALLYHVRLAIRLYSVGPWGSLALLGMTTVFAATIIERHGAAIRAHFAWLTRRSAVPQEERAAA